VKIEEKLAKLETITSQMEATDLPLERALELFEEGLTLAAGVKKDLDKARMRISKVIESTKGTFDLEPLDLE
jgi:exodeoxyribonuclease VII small subunit